MAPSRHQSPVAQDTSSPLPRHGASSAAKAGQCQAVEGRVNVSSDAILDKGQSTSRGPTVWGRTRVFALCLALVAAAPPQYADAETLHLEASPCPPSLPHEACFGSVASQTLDWGSYSPALPLETTVGYVQSLLQSAIEVEHSTIPLYLTTGYSIMNQSSFEAQTLQSVVMEEMLHMVNAANVLNAIGGAPFFDHPAFIPTYPLVMPFLNMSADVVWFTEQSMQHYQILESTPPGGYNTSISAAYLQIINLLTALCGQHGEQSVFTGNHSLQVEASISCGQQASKVFSLHDAATSLLGVADQGGGCPIDGKPWPEYSNISAGPLGGGVSHAARYEEILMGQSYQMKDAPGKPTGVTHNISWGDVYRFAPNPAISDFTPPNCVAGGAWVVRNESFFVKEMWDTHNHRLDVSTETCWEDCAKKCELWTIKDNQPLFPCAMWTWRNGSNVTVDGHVIPAGQCLLAQGGGPVTKKLPGFYSGCQFGTVCNQSIPYNNGTTPPTPPPVRSTNATLLKQCAAIHQRGIEFAANYTELLVALHNVFNGDPDSLYATVGQMYTLQMLAISLMQTHDPRIPSNNEWSMGVGPPWEYIKSSSQYEARGGLARPIIPFTKSDDSRPADIQLSADL